MEWITLELGLLYILLFFLIAFAVLPLLIGSVLMILGSFFVLSGSLGLLRLGDVYSKIHAVGVTDVMGATMMISSMVFLMPWSIVSIKMLVIILLFWIISPLTAHLLARFVILRKQSKIVLSSMPDIHINNAPAKISAQSRILTNIAKITHAKVKIAKTTTDNAVDDTVDDIMIADRTVVDRTAHNTQTETTHSRQTIRSRQNRSIHNSPVSLTNAKSTRTKRKTIKKES